MMVIVNYLCAFFVFVCCLDFAHSQSNSDTLPGFISTTWPAGIVPYQIDSSFLPFVSKRITDSIASLNNAWFCVTFRPKQDTDPAYISFVPSDVQCMSQWIGYSGSPQNIYLSNNCSTPRFVYWVLLQALGLPAEHQRPDRDNNVTVNWENVQEQYYGAFKRYDYIDQRILSVPYDVFSRLHYTNDRFTKAKGQNTIVDKSDSTITLGNVLSPTLSDYQKLAALYCPSGKFTTPTTGEPVTVPYTPEYTGGTTEQPASPASTADVPTRPPKGPSRRPGGIPASLARELIQAPPTSTAQQYCKCLDKPNAQGSCEDPTYGFQWKGMAQNCANRQSNMSNPICDCERASVNPCWCQASTTTPLTCVKKCRQPDQSSLASLTNFGFTASHGTGQAGRTTQRTLNRSSTRKTT